MISYGILLDEYFSNEVILLLRIEDICQIAQIPVSDFSDEVLNLEVDYLTARYSYVRKGCAYFSYFIGDVQEKHARLAYEKGAKILFCTKQFFTSSGEKIPCIIVKTPRKHFYEIIRYLRNLHEIQVIGITGSVGKTTTKEMIAGVLATSFCILKNNSNANSPGAIADLVQKLNDQHQIYIQEIGAWEPKYVEGGSFMVNPNMAVITNIGYPHIDLYGSIENILYDKTSLIRALPDDGVAFLNYDDERLSSYKTNKKVISFGIKNTDADYVAQNVVYEDQIIRFTIHCKEGDFPAVINMVGEHNVLNALVAFAVGRHMKIEANTILEALNNYRSEGMRQNVLNIGGYNIYMDCYNSAPNSVLTSVHALSLMKPVEGCKKVGVIGDIPRLGNRSEEVHKDVGVKLVNEEIDLYLFFGKYARATYDVMKSAGKNVLHTESREQLNSWLKEMVNPGDFILFKAGHPMALAKTVDQVYGTSFHLNDGDVLLENSKVVHSIHYDGRWIDGVVEIRRPRFDKSSVEIPDVMEGTQVVRIGNAAFMNKGLKNLSTSKALKNIGVAAFSMCNNLTDIKFAEGLMVLEEKCFYQCGLLNNVVLPKGLIEIGSLAFGDCKALQKIYIPASVNHICKDAFTGCKDLTIYCSDDSYAKIFAMEQGYKVEVIENAEVFADFMSKSLMERGILWMKGKA